MTTARRRRRGAKGGAGISKQGTKMNEKALCELCGEPMPPGEEMFKFHGHSGNCPKPPLPRKPTQQGAEATGPNPDYKGPPLKRWNVVEVVAAEGTELGLVEDNEYGLLTIIMRRAGEAWPHGMEPKAGGVNTIAPGHRVYCVRSDDCGYGIDTWQRFASYCRSCALSGENNPMDFEAFISHQKTAMSTK